MAISLKIMGGERPARPQKAQELGLTDLVWNMTCKCWRQDPARRPTVTEVVGLLRKWSVFFLSMELKSRRAPCSYKQRNVNPPLSNLAPRPLAEGVDTTTDHTLISRMPTNGKLVPIEPSEIPQRSGQTNSQTSLYLSPVLGSSREPLPDEFHIPPGTANSDDENPFSIIHANNHLAARANDHCIPPMPERQNRDPTKPPSAVQILDALAQSRPRLPPMEELPHAGNHPPISTPGTRPEVPIFKVATGRIDEIAEVTQSIALPPALIALPP